jgi:hypothetical protein
LGLSLPRREDTGVREPYAASGEEASNGPRKRHISALANNILRPDPKIIAVPLFSLDSRARNFLESIRLFWKGGKAKVEPTGPRTQD